MSKIIFVQREVEDRLGVMILSAYLKKHGMDSEIILEPYKNINEIKKKKPDFIGISLMSTSVDWTLASCRFIKKHLPDVITILGGPHPTFFPKVIEEDGVDIICIGEGEKPILQMMQSFDGTISSIERTPNLWIKKGDEITKNKLLPLLTKEELSDLPFFDRSHYQKHPGIRNTPLRRVLTSRGCPYSCSYCFNSNYKVLYNELGVMVRQRSVDSVIEELKELKKIGAKVLDFSDDQFLLSRDWTFEFCEKFKKYIDLPFVINSTAKQVNRETVAALKTAGCVSVNFAIESGVEEIRVKVYNKPTSDEDIYKAADALNSNNLPFLTYNMIGLPEENLDDIYKTVKINQEIETTYPWCSILQPYPGTKLSKHIMESKQDITPQFTYSYFQASVIGDENRRRVISNSQKLFAHFVKSKTGYDKFARMVQNHSIVSHFYPFFFYWHYGQGIRRRYRYTWPGLFKYWLYSRESNQS